MGSPFTAIRFQALNAAGPIPFAELETYAAGTLIPLVTYTSESLAFPNPTTVICDANGQADVWIGDLAYRFRLYTSTASGRTLVYDGDNYKGPGAVAAFLVDALRADLLDSVNAAKGAALVKYGGNLNYVAGTIGDHLYEVVVTDYPWLAKADDSTDNSAAILAALAFLKTKGGGKLVFPAKDSRVYRTKYAVPFVSNVEYYGEPGAVLKASDDSIDNVLGDGYAYIDDIRAAQVAGAAWNRLLKADYTGNMTETEGFITGGYAGKAKVGIKVTNLIIDGNKDVCAEGLHQIIGVPVGTFLTSESVTVVLAGSTVGTARIATPIGAVGFTFEPRSLSGTFPIGATVTGALSGATMVIVSKGADDAYQNAVRLDAVSHFTMRGCEIRNSVFSAVSIYNYSNDVLVDDCLIHSNNKPGTVYTSGWLNIYIEFFTQNVTISNCTIIGGLGYSVLCNANGGAHYDTKILNNVIWNAGSDGIRIAQDAGTDTQHAPLVAGNSVFNTVAAGSAAIRILHNGSAGAIQEARVVNNNIRTCVFGILFTGRVTRSVAAHNVIVGASSTALDCVNGTNLTGNSSHSNQSEGVIIEAVQNLTALSYIKAGATKRHPGATGISVSTSATTIRTLDNANNGALFLITGENGVNGFCDVITYAFGTIVVLSSGTSYGAPPARTYSRVGADVRLAMAAGTYSVRNSTDELG